MRIKLKKIVSGSLIITTMTILSKIVGLSRDVLIASSMGITIKADIYFYIINLISIIFATIGGGIGATIIPYMSRKKQESLDKKECFSNIMNYLIVISCLLSLAGILFPENILKLTAPGFFKKLNDEDMKLIMTLTKISFFSLIPMSIYSALKGVLNLNSKYFIPASLDFIFNLVLVIYLIFLFKKYELVGMIYFILLGNILQILVQLPSIKKLNYKYKLNFKIINNDTKQITILMLPIILGNSINQVNMIVDKMLASLLEVGKLSIMNYASKIQFLAYTVIGLGITTVTFTNLSKAISEKDQGTFEKELLKSINLMVLVMTSVIFYLFIFGDIIIEILFKRGNFNQIAVEETTLVLRILLPGMLFYGIKDLLNRAFFSLEDTKTPMINSALGGLINICGNLILINVLGVYGLALSTTISSIIITLLLILNIKKKITLNLISLLKNWILIVIIGLLINIALYLLANQMKKIDIPIFFILIITGFLLSFLILLKMIFFRKNKVI